MRKITIGMAHHTDYHGVYFSIQDIYKELIFNDRQDLLDRLEFLIIENAKDNKHAQSVKHLKNATGLGDKFRVIDLEENHGTSCTRNKLIEEANTEFVLVIDCHVFLCPVVETLDKLFDFIDQYPNIKNLYQGPLVYDNMKVISTHFNDEWGSGMWGRWGSAWSCKCGKTSFSIINADNKCRFVDLLNQKEVKECDFCNTAFKDDLDFSGHEKFLIDSKMKQLGKNKNDTPFEIFSQGLGMFFTAKEHWLGFNSQCKGFGGEECYIHEKYRKSGRKAICLPFLRWLHRFERPDGIMYELTTENKIRNYLLEFKELDLDIDTIRTHFVGELGYGSEKFDDILKEVNMTQVENKM
jgi:hypothetical protein